MSQFAYRYRKAGLSIASEIILTGLIGDGSDEFAADIVIRRHAVAPALTEASSRVRHWELVGDALFLHVPGVARFLMRDGANVDFELEAGGTEADVATYINGVVFGMLMHQRQRVVLHASAVEVRGRAVLFCGRTGVGKSTIAAALGLRGYPLVSDDLCVFDQDVGEQPTVFADGRTLRLWSESIEGLDLSARRGVRVRPSMEKFYFDSQACLSESTALAAVYVLRDAQAPRRPGIDVTNNVDAALLLAGSAYRPLLVDRMKQKELYFRAATSIANRVGVFHLTTPSSFAKMPDVVNWLEQHWLELEIMKSPARI